MVQKQREVLRLANEAARSVVGCWQVVLAGSAVHQTATQHSDQDCVVLTNGTPATQQMRAELAREIERRYKVGEARPAGEATTMRMQPNTFPTAADAPTPQAAFPAEQVSVLVRKRPIVLTAGPSSNPKAFSADIVLDACTVGHVSSENLLCHPLMAWENTDHVSWSSGMHAVEGRGQSGALSMKYIYVSTSPLCMPGGGAQALRPAPRPDPCQGCCGAAEGAAEG